VQVREKRSLVAVQVRRSWILALGGAALLAALLGWAWSDAGLRPLTPQSEPALLPQVTR
jgi:hypothetical protein